MHYNFLPKARLSRGDIVMNRIAPTFLIFVLFLFSCNGNEFDAAQMPIAATVPRPPTASDGSEIVQRSPDVAQNEEPYPVPTEIHDYVVEDSTAIRPTDVPDLAGYGTTPATPESNLPPAGYSGSPELVENAPFYSYRVVNKYPHDRNAWTQGLIMVDGDSLLEGTGLRGQSSLRRTVLETGEITQIEVLPDMYFGEGITIFEDEIVQLTWQAGIGFIYDSVSFEMLDSFDYAHEGWGITDDGQKLIVSDGTSTLHFWDPETMIEIEQIQVSDEFGPVVQLNELEYVEGEIFANIWQTDLIARISPETGQVIGWINLTGLLAADERDGTESVLNGIAYDPETERLFVTGKRWPLIYEIELVPQ